MILGMSIGSFALLHVVITLVAIGSGLIVVGGMFASRVLPVTTALFLFTTTMTSRNGVPISHSRFHASTRCRYPGLRDPVVRAVRAVQRARSRCMASDLCDHRSRIAIFKFLRSSRAELRESISPQCVGSDTVRAAVCPYADRCHDDEAAYNHRRKTVAKLTYDKQLTALLVIDPYNDFISEGGKIWPHIKAVAEANNCIPHMLEVLNAARKATLRVFYAMHHRYRRGDYETWKYVAPIQKAAWQHKTFEYGTWGGEFRAEFVPRRPMSALGKASGRNRSDF